MDKVYSILYQIPNVVLSIYNKTNDRCSQITLSSGDIVSFTVIDNYDNATYPIIRLRLSTDISTIGYINENPDNLKVDMTLEGKMVQLNESDSNKEYTIVKGILSEGLHFDGYVETKNNPYSKYDNYEHGIQKNSNLNTNKKIPIDIYCYYQDIVHKMKSVVPSIYHNMSISSVIQRIMSDIECDILPPSNSEKYDQILLPNLSRIDALAYIDRMYGIYESGASLYCDMFKRMMLFDTDQHGSPYFIFVKSYKSSNGSSNVKYEFNGPNVSIPAESIVIKTETSIEQTLNSKFIAAINSMTFDVQTEELSELYSGNNSIQNISTPNIISKTKNKFLASMYKQRVNEHITHVDVSMTGTQLDAMTNATRFSLCFDEPIRGLDMNKKIFRPSNATHILSNIGSGWFECTSTMRLC